jgi:uncharacterized protein (TIGR02996 family)
VTDEAELLELMRATPDDEGPKLVYADWLLARGDVRGELLILEHHDRMGTLTGADPLERLLELAAEHGFPRLPDDPCAGILPFYGGGSFPVQYHLDDHEGHSYYLRWRDGFSIDVDDETVLEGDLETTTTNEWTFPETTVILAIVSDAIRRGAPLSALTFPAADEYPKHPRYHLGRAPAYTFPEAFLHERGRAWNEWLLEVRDFERWYALWDRRQRLRGIEPPPTQRLRCACGVEGLTCKISECEARVVP